MGEMTTRPPLCLGTGLNPYTDQLAQLESRVPPAPTDLPEALLEITTPLKRAVWEQELANHPDHGFASYVTKGITIGFRVGFNRTSALRNCSSNMQSAREHPEVVSSYLEREKILNRMIVVQPEDLPPHQPLRCNTKKGQAGALAFNCRLILPNKR